MQSKNPRKPDVIGRKTRLSNNKGQKHHKLLLAALIVFFVLSASITLLLGSYLYQPEITAWLQKSISFLNSAQVSQTRQPAQVNLPTQTPLCTGASLQLGTSIWNIEPIQRNIDGSVDVPEDTPDMAYWINDLELNRVFALSPTQDNLDVLGAVQGGEVAIITWESCNTATYSLFTQRVGVPDDKVFQDRTVLGIIIYVPATPQSAGRTVEGVISSETVTTPPTSVPSSSAVNAEISFLEISTSQDRKTIQVVISIMNNGSEPITISEGDILLTPVGATPLALSRSDPSLPQEILTAESRTFSLVFPRPETATATLKIFTLEFDLNNY